MDPDGWGEGGGGVCFIRRWRQHWTCSIIILEYGQRADRNSNIMTMSWRKRFGGCSADRRADQSVIGNGRKPIWRGSSMNASCWWLCTCISPPQPRYDLIPLAETAVAEPKRARASFSNNQRRAPPSSPHPQRNTLHYTPITTNLCTATNSTYHILPHTTSSSTMFRRAIATAPAQASKLLSAAARPQIASPLRTATPAVAVNARRSYHEKDESPRSHLPALAAALHR